MPPVNSVVRVTGRNSGERSALQGDALHRVELLTGHAQLHLLLDVGQELFEPLASLQSQHFRQRDLAVAVDVHLVEDLADGGTGLELPRRRLQGLRHLDDEGAEVVRGAGVDGEEHAAPALVGEGVRGAAHAAEGIGLAVGPAGDAGEGGLGRSEVVRACARSRGQGRDGDRVHELDRELVPVLLAFDEVVGQAEALQRVGVGLVRLEVLRLRDLDRVQAVRGPRAVGRLAHLLDGRDEQPDEDRDDRDHDEQLDERESGFALGA